MIKLKNGYEIESNGKSFTLFKYVIQERKDGSIMEAKKQISFHSTLSSALQGYSNCVMAETIKRIGVDLMTTKQEYIDILGQMEELYYNSDNCTLAMNLFKEDINLLTRLVNEHFEEKAETNYEHFKDEIIQNVKYALAVVNGEPKQCADTNCDECEFNESGKCVERVIEWLNKQYKKPVSVYKLTKFEKELLQCYPDIYSFKVFNSLNGMKEKGYFKDIDDNEIIGDILANCEVIG